MITALVALDPVGNVSLIFQIVTMFLLVLGLPFFRSATKNKKNLLAHGYSTVAALILNSILIFVVMIPSFTGGLSEIGDLSLFASVTVLSHALLGTLAVISAIIMIASWLWKGPTKLTCATWKKWMLPTFIIWAIAIVNGTLVHILGLL